MAVCGSSDLGVQRTLARTMFARKEGGVHAYLDGERLDMIERLVVSPTNGLFDPQLTVEPDEGMKVVVGQVVAMINVLGAAPVPVVSHFDGELIGMLAVPGERVGAGQPVAWLRVA